MYDVPEVKQPGQCHHGYNIGKILTLRIKQF